MASPWLPFCRCCSAELALVLAAATGDTVDAVSGPDKWQAAGRWYAMMLPVLDDGLGGRGGPWTQRRAVPERLGLDRALDGRPLACTYVGRRSNAWTRLEHGAHARGLQRLAR